MLSLKRVVLDTDVAVAAARSDRGASFQWLLAALEHRITLLLSVPLCLEYEAVLTRSEHLQATTVTAADMRRLLDALAAVAEPVEIRFLWRPDLRDPDDAKVLEAAVDGRADWLLTFTTRRRPSPDGLRSDGREARTDPTPVLTAQRSAKTG